MKDGFNLREEREWKKFELIAGCLGWKPPEQCDAEMSAEELAAHNAMAEQMWEKLEKARVGKTDS